MWCTFVSILPEIMKENRWEGANAKRLLRNKSNPLVPFGEATLTVTLRKIGKVECQHDILQVSFTEAKGPWLHHVGNAKVSVKGKAFAKQKASLRQSRKGKAFAKQKASLRQSQNVKHLLLAALTKSKRPFSKAEGTK